MKKNIKLPFTNELKGGNKKSFKILNEEQIVNKLKKDVSMLNIIKKFINLNNSNNSNKINYVKASNTKEYYKKINKK
jgi:hypothetical protein